MSLISNIQTYRAIAEEAHSAMREGLATAISPKPDGLPGNIIRYDPDQRSFKNAMIAIAFVGMYLDALLYISLLKKLGVEKARKVDREEHEKRFEALGVSDKNLLAKVVSFRVARKELVHEKAVELSDLKSEKVRSAQGLAEEAMTMIQEVRLVLGVA